jgi:hypothetical protein
MQAFNKQKTTANQLRDDFRQDLMNDISVKSCHIHYLQNKIKEYNYLKAL